MSEFIIKLLCWRLYWPDLQLLMGIPFKCSCMQHQYSLSIRRNKSGVIVHQKLVHSVGKILKDLKQTITDTYGNEFTKCFTLSCNMQSTPYQAFDKDEDNWLSYKEEETLNDLLGSEGEIFLEGSDIFLKNAQRFEIPGDSKEIGLLKNIGSLGGVNSKAQNECQNVHVNSSRSSSNSTGVDSPNDQETLCMITWCNDLINNQEFIKTIKRRSLAIPKEIVQDESCIGKQRADLIMQGDQAATITRIKQQLLKLAGRVGHDTTTNLIVRA